MAEVRFHGYPVEIIKVRIALGIDIGGLLDSPEIIPNGGIMNNIGSIGTICRGDHF